MQECRHESDIYNYQRIQLSNNKFINVILGGTLDLGLDQFGKTYLGRSTETLLAG